MIRGSNPCRDKILFSSLKYPDQFVGAPSLIFNSYMLSFPRAQRSELEIDPLVPRLRMSGAIPLLPLYDVMARTGAV